MINLKTFMEHNASPHFEHQKRVSVLMPNSLQRKHFRWSVALFCVARDVWIKCRSASHKGLASAPTGPVFGGFEPYESNRISSSFKACLNNKCVIALFSLFSFLKIIKLFYTDNWINSSTIFRYHLTPRLYEL